MVEKYMGASFSSRAKRMQSEGGEEFFGGGCKAFVIRGCRVGWIPVVQWVLEGLKKIRNVIGVRHILNKNAVIFRWICCA